MKPALASLAISNALLITLLFFTFPRVETFPENPTEIETGDRYYYNCEIVRVIDGDTVEARIDLGFDTARLETLRLYGINTPEMRGAEKLEGQKAKAWLETQLANGEEITIRTIKDKTGSFGRYLAVLFCDGRNLNEQMLTEKIAKIYE